MAVGLAVIALELVWAENLLEQTLDRLSEAGEKVKRAGPLEQAAVALVGVLAFAVAVTVADVWDVPLLPV